MPSLSVSTGVDVFPFSVLSEMPSPSLSKSKWFGVPSPSVSVGVHGAVPVHPTSSVASKMPSPSLSKSL